MSEEIKEIVRDNDELLVLYKDNSFRTFDTVTVDVIDYIINLQQENHRLKDELEWYKQQCDDLEMQIGCQE